MIKLIIRFTIVAVVLLLGGFIALKLAAMKKPPVEIKAEEIPLSVKGIPITYDDHTITISGYGTVRSARRVAISPEVGGKVVYIRLPLESGEVVEKGEVLFRIDPQNYELILRSAEAEIDALNAQTERIKQQQENDQRRLKILKRSYDLVLKRHERLRTLFENQEVGTLSEVEAAENAVVLQEDQITMLENALALYPRQLSEIQAALISAEVRKNTAQLDLDRTEVSAPFRGRLDEPHIEQEQLLVRGQPVLTLVDDENLEIPVSLDSMEVQKWLLSFEDESTKLREAWYSHANESHVTIDWTQAPEKFSWPGQIVRIERFNVETRTIIAVVKPVEVDLSKRPKSLPIAEGMFCNVNIPSPFPIHCIRVPRGAVTHERNVYMAIENRLHRRPVDLFFEDMDYAYIRGDLKEGEIVITTKLINPLEGSLLAIQLPFAKDEE